VEVLHDGKPIDAPVYTFSAFVENSGSKDIIERHFIDPIEIEGQEVISFLSVDATASDGVSPTVEVEGGKLYVRWKILKPQERVTLSGVASVEGPNRSSSQLTRYVKPVMRLVDVKVGAGMRRIYPFALGVFVSSSVICTTFLVAFLYDRGGDEYVFTPAAGRPPIVARAVVNGFQECVAKPNALSLSDCRAISAQEFARAVSISTFRPAQVGLSVIEYVSAAALAILYGILIPAIFGILSRLRRRLRGSFRDLRA
jgi:hypothetical protein